MVVLKKTACGQLEIPDLGNSIWKGVVSKDVLDKKAKQWEGMKAEDVEKEFFWWLAGATFLQLGTWSAGYSYKEVVWMQTEASRLECRGDSILQVSIPLEITLVNGVIILQETFEKYSLVSRNPRELLRVKGEEA